MIYRLVQSALQTGCLSVESEGLIRQMLILRSYQASDIDALNQLFEAIHRGQVKREAQGHVDLLPLARR